MGPSLRVGDRSLNDPVLAIPLRCAQVKTLARARSYCCGRGSRSAAGRRSMSRSSCDHRDRSGSARAIGRGMVCLRGRCEYHGQPLRPARAGVRIAGRSGCRSDRIGERAEGTRVPMANRNVGVTVDDDGWSARHARGGGVRHKSIAALSSSNSGGRECTGGISRYDRLAARRAAWR
jgi:hypothetical protein